MSMSVCLYVYERMPGATLLVVTKFLCMLHIALALRYVMYFQFRG